MNFKKILSTLLAVMMLLSVFTVSLSAEDEFPFTDVKEDDWHYDAVSYAYKNGLMNGTGDGSKFSPDMNLTRGMVMTVLHRSVGAPKVVVGLALPDIDDDQYYANAAKWAYKEGVITGTGEDEWGDPYLSPDRNITRQELATMFARFAKYKYVDTTKKNADISGFSDVANVASWAEDAIKWAVGNGIINGKGAGAAVTLSPLDPATRAEFATIIQRFNTKTLEFEYVHAYAQPMLKSSYTEPDYPLVKDADVYVSVDGKDSNPGTFEKPLATLEGAKAKVRELKKDAKDEIVVAFMAGNYGKLNNVTFTADDAGTETVPVKYCKYGDGDVIFSNGVIISEKDFTAITAEEAKLFPAESASKVRKIDLSGLMPDKFVSTHNYLYSKDNGICWLARDLNKNSQGQDLYYRNQTTESSDRMKSIKLEASLKSVVDNFKTHEGLMVKGMLRCGYLFDRFDVISYDKETGEMFMDIENWETLMPDMPEGRFDYHGGFATEGRMEDKIFFYNLAEFMDDNGEYWVDLKTNIMYIYAPKGSYTFCTDGTMMTIEEGADHISFVGLEFNGCDDTMVYSNADYITYDRCIFANIGGFYAIKAVGVNHFNFINCESYNFVDGSLFMESDADQANIIPAGNVIRNNYFHDFGLSEYWSNGVRVKYDVGLIIEHNEFRRGAHGALRYDRCIDTYIQYNVFDSMMQVTEDYGAVYTINAPMHRSNVIRYNLFSNIIAGGANVGAAYGIYIDDFTCGQEIYGNIFYNGGAHSITLHDGRDNYVHDNVSISIKQGNMMFTGDLLMYTAGMSSYVSADGTLDPNYVNGKLYKYLLDLPTPEDEGYDLWYSRWPLMFNYNYDPTKIGELECGFTTVNTIKNNYSIGSGFDPGETFDRFAVAENNISYTLDENPLFVNPSIGDYSIKEDADFHKIPYEMIGRY